MFPKAVAITILSKPVDDEVPISVSPNWTQQKPACVIAIIDAKCRTTQTEQVAQ